MSYFIDIKVVPVQYNEDDTVVGYGVEIDTNLSSNDMFKVLSDILAGREEIADE